MKQKLFDILDTNGVTFLKENNTEADGHIKELKEEFNGYLQDVCQGKVDINELEEIELTPTLVLIGKIEKILIYMKTKNIKKYVLQLDFITGLNYAEFTDYFEFIEDDNLDCDFTETTSTFKIYKRSKNYKGVFLLNEEIYDHEDDTDAGRYYLVLLNN
ncbi:MAG: hypothetical protein PHF46_01705 [Candidatus Gracilibacteria bacterium]|nr:hypothetical protein [Candidatus Gracilibacteria bacterium]MDD3120104.1 hypothetical protein [Candidatus Gracilibacteria bacterium]MDD4530321.1 hypothetical protein [Candidatus Gracilibacteria bacterium]